LEESAENVLFNGRLIKRKDLPQSNFSRPIVINLAYTGRFFDQLLFSTSVKFKSAYDSLEQSDSIAIVAPGPEGDVSESISVYYTAHYDASFMIDCTLSWEQKLPWDQTLTVILEIDNVMDKKNKISREVDSWDTYELGRQFWLGVTYEF
jgi:hypothetical protein